MLPASGPEPLAEYDAVSGAIICPNKKENTSFFTFCVTHQAILILVLALGILLLVFLKHYSVL